jgi:hypothetical protein
MKLRITERLLIAEVDAQNSKNVPKQMRKQNTEAFISKVKNVVPTIKIYPQGSHRSNEVKGTRSKSEIEGINGRIADLLIENFEKFLDQPDQFGDLPSRAYAAKVRVVWYLWRKLIGTVHHNKGDPPIDLQAKLDSFAEFFLDLYGKNYVTPYIHILCAHGVMLLEEFQDLSRRCQQGIERVHGLQKLGILKCTSKGGGTSFDALVYQALVRYYRIQQVQNIDEVGSESGKAPWSYSREDEMTLAQMIELAKLVPLKVIQEDLLVIKGDLQDCQEDGVDS